MFLFHIDKKPIENNYKYININNLNNMMTQINLKHFLRILLGIDPDLGIVSYTI